MNIIAGATGQVGSALVKALSQKNLPVRAVIRNDKAQFERGVEVRTADLFNPDQLRNAFEGGTSVFVFTPEDPASEDIIGDTKRIVENYKSAIRRTGISKIVGLSSIGAHVKGNTGNILMSGILEQAFEDIDAEKIYIRPSYYYSNWLGYLEIVKQSGILPTFFPPDFKVAMNSPIDVARFITDVFISSIDSRDTKFFELTGPQNYSSAEVATIFSNVLGRNVVAQMIPEKEWHNSLVSAGFTEDASLNMSDMTTALISGLLGPEDEENTIKLQTSLQDYLSDRLGSK